MPISFLFHYFRLVFIRDETFNEKYTKMLVFNQYKFANLFLVNQTIIQNTYQNGQLANN